MKKIISIAPGRTCLFGDHQDYLNLPIIACAINKHITLIAKENSLNALELSMPDIQEKRSIKLNEPLININKQDNFLSSIKVLKRYNCNVDKGYDIEIKGTIPINSGTSSSSALVIAWIQFLIKAFGDEKLLNPETISQIAYEAEVVEHNAPGGKMDQFSIGLGNIIFLETGEDFSYKVIKKPLNNLIMAESGVPKKTISLLKKLKSNSWRAINEVKKKIPDFSIETAKISKLDYYLNLLDENLRPYLHAAIGNYHVTLKALNEFEKDQLNLHKIGNLMNEHHHYLKDFLKITVPKIDLMIETVKKNGALGAKIVGSGGGGSIAIIALEKDKKRIINALKNIKVDKVYPVSVDKGAYVSCK